MDKAEGKMKEAYGAIIGDEAKKAEGRALQRKAEAAEEAEQREKTRQAEAEAKEAEKERDRQRRKDNGGLGGLTGTLTGR
ncbi:MAG: CsbD family protein [Rubrobacter sp.]|nr:CsbD family protein [Rubrobacter sp.]